MDATVIEHIVCLVVRSSLQRNTLCSLCLYFYRGTPSVVCVWISTEDLRLDSSFASGFETEFALEPIACLVVRSSPTKQPL